MIDFWSVRFNEVETEQFELKTQIKVIEAVRVKFLFYQRRKMNALNIFSNA